MSKQLSFDFTDFIDISAPVMPEPAGTADRASTAAATSEPSVASVEMPKKSIIRVPEQLHSAVWLDDLDMDKTVIIHRGKKGLKIQPANKNAATKLWIAGRRFQDQENPRAFAQLLSYVTIQNLDADLDANHPLVHLLSQYDLDIAITPEGASTLRAIRRRFKRLMLPFKFKVPEQFKDLQDDNKDYVSGPFVQDVCKAEIKSYMKRIENLGWLDGSGGVTLYPYQAEDIAIAACKREAFLNHDMGLGKTLMATALTHMHQPERVLIVAPGAAIGSWQSGWRHELHRMGVPKENIHVVEGPEDLPNPILSYKSERPHYWLVDYGVLSREKWAWAAFTCPGCSNTVDAKDQGTCKAMVTNLNGGLYPCGETPKMCPCCHQNARTAAGGKKHMTTQTLASLKENWTGNFCKTCGFRVKFRVGFKGREADGLKEKKPVWKCIKPWMFKEAVFDESHLIKNASTRRGKAAQQIPGIDRCYIMTGTMLTNYVSDSFWQLHRIFGSGWFPIEGKLQNYLSFYGQKEGVKQFLDRFESRRASTGRVAQINNREQFWGMMAKIQMRRHQDDPDVNAQTELPEIKFHTELIEMDPYHKQLYRMKTGEFQEDMRKQIAKVKGDKVAAEMKAKDLAPIPPANLRTKLQELRQVASCPDQTGIYNRGNKLSLTTKDYRILELVKEETDRNDKVVVFCSWRAQIARLQMMFKQEKIEAMVIDGSVQKSEKWARIDEWRTDFDTKVLLASIDSMGQAVNLTSLDPDAFKCKRIIFSSPEWVPMKMEQAWGRIRRIGQDSAVECYFLYHQATIEEEMDALLYQKRETIAAAMDRVEITRDDDVEILTYAEIAARLINRHNAEEPEDGKRK